MLSLLASAVPADIMVELPMPMLSPMMQAAPTPFMMGGLSEMLGQLKNMHPVVQRPPTNPCAQDLARLRCADSACLKRSAETLLPACAAFLLGPPEPSPAPEPRPSRPTESMRIEMSGQSDERGYFTMISSGPDGQVRRVSGPLGSGSRPSMTMGLPAGLLAPFAPLAPELLAMLGVEVTDDAEEDDDEDGEAQHPCAREIPICTRETQSRATDKITACLVKHVAQLSPECRCFVHHMARPAAPATATPAKPIARPSVPSAATMAAMMPHTLSAVGVGMAPATVTVVTAMAAEEDGAAAARKPIHRLSCLLFFATLFLVAFLLARACVHALCGARPPARRIVVVPPLEGSKTIAKKTSAASKAKAVQVAELYVKA